MDRHARRAGFDEAAGFLAVDDERVGGPPAPGLIGRGARPALEGHRVVEGEHDGNAARDPAEHQGIEPGTTSVWTCTTVGAARETARANARPWRPSSPRRRRVEPGLAHGGRRRGPNVGPSAPGRGRRPPPARPTPPRRAPPRARREGSGCSGRCRLGPRRRRAGPAARLGRDRCRGCCGERDVDVVGEGVDGHR